MPGDIMDVGAEAWQPEGITVLATPIGSALHCREDGREDLQGKTAVGSNSFRTRSSVCLADPVAERQPSTTPLSGVGSSQRVKVYWLLTSRTSVDQNR